MARQIAAIRSGLSPAQAYDTEERNRDDAKEPLLNERNRLFHLASDRNRELTLLNQSLTKVAERTRELSASNARLREMAMTDVLTALPNQRHAHRRTGPQQGCASVRTLRRRGPERQHQHRRCIAVPRDGEHRRPYAHR